MLATSITFLYDRGYISHKEPFKRLINQGMIQGRTQFVYRSNSNENLFISKGLIKNDADVTPIRVDVNIVENDVLNIDAFKQWRAEYANAEFELEDGNYICGWEIEKMSKSKYNVVNPDDVIDKYGADCFRMYEMFLGPIEQSKPWNTAGIEGVSKFLRRFWNLYFDENGHAKLTKNDATEDELKVLHRTIDKLGKDIENFSFNTSVSALMIALNEFNTLKTTSESVLIPLLKSICPFAPHTAETIWSRLGNNSSIIVEEFPSVDEKYLVDDTIEYPVSINGKMRAKVSLAADADEAAAKETALSNETVIKWLEGKEIKKFIFVQGRMINVVI
jgi:leucyl-tRNA synthetase